MATFAEEMLTKYEAVLRANVGVASIVVDGVTVTYQDLEKRYLLWHKRVAREKGRCPVAATIQLRGPNA